MAKAPLEIETTDGAQSVRRAMSVLRLVAMGQHGGVRLTDIAAMSGLPRPTVHRLLKVLIDETAVEQDPMTRRYRIGNEIALLGLARPSGLSIRAVAEPYLAALAAEVGDTVFLSVKHGSDSVGIARSLGTHPIQVLSIEVGARRPLGASVSGIALLAGMPPAQSAALTQANEKRLKALGRSVKEVLSAVQAARRLGYVHAPKGLMPGTSALALPVRDGAGNVVAAISIASMAERLGGDRLREVLATMHAQVARMTARLAELEEARPTRAR